MHRYPFLLDGARSAPYFWPTVHTLVSRRCLPQAFLQDGACVALNFRLAVHTLGNVRWYPRPFSAQRCVFSVPCLTNGCTSAFRENAFLATVCTCACISAKRLPISSYQAEVPPSATLSVPFCGHGGLGVPPRSSSVISSQIPLNTKRTDTNGRSRRAL